jgi:hypothetical protein
MANTRTKKNFGPSGTAKLSILKSGVRVMFKDGDVYDVQGAAPDGIKNGEYVVTLSADKTRIMSVKAPAGQYIFRFSRFGNRTVGKTPESDGLPTNKVMPARVATKKDGTTFPVPAQLICVVELEIADGPYAGLTTSTNMPYSFAAPVTGEMTDFYDTTRNIDQWQILFRAATGKSIEVIDIPYSDEPPQLLTRFEKFFNDNERLFLGSTNEKGFLDIKSVSPLPDSLMPKKSTKKATTKKAKK